MPPPAGPRRDDSRTNPQAPPRPTGSLAPKKAPGSSFEEAAWTVHAVPLSRLADLAPLALASATEDRKTIVLSLLADLLRRSAGRDLYLAELLQAGQTIAAAIAIRTADDSASLVAAHALSSPEASENRLPESGNRHPASVFQHLLGHLHQRLADAGVTFVQAMREAEVDQAALVSCGYESLATLDYLVNARRVSPGSARSARDLPARDLPARDRAGGKAVRRTDADALRFIPYETYFRSLESRAGEDAPREGLVALLDATYIDSLDCPQMERFRSAAAMVDSYRRSPAYNPDDWQILVDGGDRAIGCLLATAHPASGSLEITYMGLIPETRHRGQAAAILERAWAIADRYGLPQLTLAVDRANRPAIKLYQRHGFEVLMSETVWARSLGSERDISSGGEKGPTRTAKES